MSSASSQHSDSARRLFLRGMLLMLAAVAAVGGPGWLAARSLLSARQADDVGAAQPLLALTLLAGAGATGALDDSQRTRLEAIARDNASVRWLAWLGPDGSGPEFRDEKLGVTREELVRAIDLRATVSSRRPAPAALGAKSPVDLWTIPLRGERGVLAAALDTRPRETDATVATVGWGILGLTGLILSLIGFQRGVIRPVAQFQERMALLRAELAELTIFDHSAGLDVTTQVLAQLTEELRTLRTESRLLRHTMHNRVEAQADRAARAVQRAERDAELDPLTRVKTRRVLERELPRLFSQHRAAGGELTVALIDLDNFKVLNDTLGHHRGDELLAATGDLLRACVRRAGDIITRYGGDEFVVVMPQATPREALAVMHRFVELLSERVRALPATTPRAGVSIGIAGMNVHQAESPDNLLKMADAAMYAAKRGAARVLLYDPTMRRATQS